MLHDYSSLCPNTSIFRDHRNFVGQCRVCAAYLWLHKLYSGNVYAVVSVSAFTMQKHLAAGYFEGAHLWRVIDNALLDHETVSHLRAPSVAGPLRLGYVGYLISNQGNASPSLLDEANDPLFCVFAFLHALHSS